MSHIDYVFATRAAAEAIRDFCCTVGHEIGAEGAAAGVWAPDPVDFLLDALRARMAAPADAPDSHRVEYAVDAEEHIIHALELPAHVVETGGTRVLVISDGEDTGWSAHAELAATRIDAVASASREGFAAPRGVAILCGADGALLDFPEGPFAVRYSVDDPVSVEAREGAVYYAMWGARGSILAGEADGIFRTVCGGDVSILI